MVFPYKNANSNDAIAPQEDMDDCIIEEAEEEDLCTGSAECNENVHSLTKEDLKLIPGETRVVAHSVEQRVHVELLQLLTMAEAPDYLFKEIIDWASRAKAANYNFNPKLSSRGAVLKDLLKHFNLQNLRPKISLLKLESIKEPVPIVSFDLKSTIFSLLGNSNLMQPKNLVINDAIEHPDGSIDYSPWFQPFKPKDGYKVHEILSGCWYQDTVASMDCSKSNIFCAP